MYIFRLYSLKYLKIYYIINYCIMSLLHYYVEKGTCYSNYCTYIAQHGNNIIK